MLKNKNNQIPYFKFCSSPNKEHPLKPPWVLKEKKTMIVHANIALNSASTFRIYCFSFWQYSYRQSFPHWTRFIKKWTILGGLRTSCGLLSFVGLTFWILYSKSMPLWFEWSSIEEIEGKCESYFSKQNPFYLGVGWRWCQACCCALCCVMSYPQNREHWEWVVPKFDYEQIYEIKFYFWK